MRLPGLLEVALVGDHSNGGDAVPQGDLPGPCSLQPEEVEEHIAEASLRLGPEATEPRPDRVLVERRVLSFQTQLIGQEATPARSIDDHPREDVPHPSFGQLDSRPDGPAILEQDLFHGRPLDDLGPNLVGMPEQQQIHVVALDVEAVGARGVRRDKVCGADGHELPDRRPRGSPSDAVLVDETGVLHLRQETDPVEHEVVGGDQGLPDMVTRVDVLLEDQGLVPVPGQQRGEGRTSRSPTDDDDVCLMCHGQC